MRRVLIAVLAAVALLALLAATPNGATMSYNGDAGQWTPVATKPLPTDGLVNGCTLKWNGDAGSWDCN